MSGAMYIMQATSSVRLQFSAREECKGKGRFQ